MELRVRRARAFGANALTRLSRHFGRAGDGNRTRMTSLEDWFRPIS